MSDYVFRPEGYAERIRDEVGAYDELQRRAAEATLGIDAEQILDLGVGTGETARRILELHRGARLTGIDASAEMLEQARVDLPADRIDGLTVSRVEDPLPSGPFDLVVSVLVVHHLDADAKADLFRRIAAVLRPGGRFALGDVVVPERREDAVISLTEGFDRPDAAAQQLEWLGAAGLSARVYWAEFDLAVLVADAV